MSESRPESVASTRTRMGPLTILRLAFTVLWVVVFAFAAVESRTFPGSAGTFPLSVSIVGLFLGLLSLVMDVLSWRRDGTAVRHDLETSTASAVAFEEEGRTGLITALRRSGWYLLWILFYILLIYLIGAVAASGLYLFLFLRFEARAGWTLSIVGPLASMLLLRLLGALTNLIWPTSLIAPLQGG